jgi:hypothetical protein
MYEALYVQKYEENSWGFIHGTSSSEKQINKQQQQQQQFSYIQFFIYVLSSTASGQLQS